MGPRPGLSCFINGFHLWGILKLSMTGTVFYVALVRFSSGPSFQ
jgi:hypothetical protein